MFSIVAYVLACSAMGKTTERLVNAGDLALNDEKVMLIVPNPTESYQDR